MSWQLAQLNIARFRRPQGDPVNADFIASLDRVNAVAEQQPGFVWRMTGEGNDAMDVRVGDDPNLVVNLSVWADFESLRDFVYRHDAHLNIMRRRREWFDAIQAHLVLWWIPAGDRPSIDDAIVRLERLRADGPTADAFTFREPYPAPDSARRAEAAGDAGA